MTSLNQGLHRRVGRRAEAKDPGYEVVLNWALNLQRKNLLNMHCPEFSLFKMAAQDGGQNCPNKFGIVVKNKDVNAVIIIFPTVLNTPSHCGQIFTPENDSGHWHFNIYQYYRKGSMQREQNMEQNEQEQVEILAAYQCNLCS